MYVLLDNKHSLDGRPDFALVITVLLFKPGHTRKNTVTAPISAVRSLVLDSTALVPLPQSLDWYSAILDPTNQPKTN
jgi:hypothetical protein